MQILQWLFNTAAPEPPKIVSNSTSITQKKSDEDKKIIPKDIVVSITDHRGRRRHLKGVEKSKLNCENLVLFRFLQRKDVSRPFFYRTLNLKRLGSFRDWGKTTREEIARRRGVSQWVDSSTLGGNKVLPIAHDSAQSSSRNDDDNQLPHLNEKDKRKNNKKKAVSRVKELLKWATTAKNLKNGAASNVVVDDAQVCDESPKISIRWEMESCPNTTTTSTTTTIYTTMSTISRVSSTSKDDHIECGGMLDSTADLQVRDQYAAGIGNWITTDSEFVVLEL